MKAFDYLPVWAVERNMKFSLDKSAVVLLLREKDIFNPQLSLDGTELQRTEK